jgi:hypothetical protein
MLGGCGFPNTGGLGDDIQARVNYVEAVLHPHPSDGEQGRGNAKRRVSSGAARRQRAMPTSLHNAAAARQR